MSSSNRSFKSKVLRVPISLDKPMLLMELTVELTGKHRENFLREIFEADPTFEFITYIKSFLNFISDDKAYIHEVTDSIVTVVEELKFNLEQEQPIKNQKKKLKKPICIVDPKDYGRVDIYDENFQYIYDLSTMSQKDQHRLCYQGFDPATGELLAPLEEEESMDQECSLDQDDEEANEAEQNVETFNDVLIISSHSLSEDAMAINKLAEDHAGDGAINIYVPPRSTKVRNEAKGEPSMTEVAIRNLFEPDEDDAPKSPTYAPYEEPPFQVIEPQKKKVPTIIKRDLKLLQNSRLHEFITGASNFKQKFRYTRPDVLDSSELNDITRKYFGLRTNDLFRVCGPGVMRLVVTASLKRKKRYDNFIAEIAPFGILELGSNRVVT